MSIKRYIQALVAVALGAAVAVSCQQKIERIPVLTLENATIGNAGGSQFLDMRPPQTSIGTGGNGNNTFSYSRGSAATRLTQWDQLRERTNRLPAAIGLVAALGACLVFGRANMLIPSVVAIVAAFLALRRWLDAR